VYHSIKDRPEGLDPYALYVIVEKGQLKVVHVFGKHSTSVIVGEGFLLLFTFFIYSFHQA
jgi:hypothetical protein